MIAWRCPKIQKHHDTGHVCFVVDTPKEIDKRVFNVIVYDSSNSRTSAIRAGTETGNLRKE